MDIDNKEEKRKAIQKIVDAAKLYKENYAGKKILYIYGTINKPELLEAVFKPSNFRHLTGVVSSKKDKNNLEGNISALEFYKKCLNKRLSIKDFELKENGTTKAKLEILSDVLRADASIKMAGDYNNSGEKLLTDKLVGSVYYAMGFLKAENEHTEYYFPNTILNDDIRKKTDKARQMLAIYKKNISDERYNSCIYVAKGIDVHDICFPEKFYYLALDCITVDFPEKSIIKVENHLLNNKQVNSIYLPSGLKIDEKDVGRSIVSPDFIQKKDGKLIGVFEYKPGEEHTVKISLEDGSFQKVDINLFKKAMEEKGVSHNNPEANKEKQNTKERYKENEEEL